MACARGGGRGSKALVTRGRRGLCQGEGWDAFLTKRGEVKLVRWRSHCCCVGLVLHGVAGSCGHVQVDG